MKLTTEEILYADSVYAELVSGKPTGTAMEWLWQTIEDILEGPRTQERRDAMEDMTLLDLCRRTADEAAMRRFR